MKILLRVMPYLMALGLLVSSELHRSRANRLQETLNRAMETLKLQDGVLRQQAEAIKNQDEAVASGASAVKRLDELVGVTMTALGSCREKLYSK